MPPLKIYDMVGVGFGPSNIALAIALEECGSDLDYVFLEKQTSTFWQGGMLLDGSDIQNNPLRDLVTPRNPCSPYSFINYLKEQHRLFAFLNLGMRYPLRKDYAAYVSWVAEHFSDRVIYDSQVISIEITDAAKTGALLWRVQNSTGEAYFARSLIYAAGRQARIPAVFEEHLGPRVFHLNDYLRQLPTHKLSDARIAVIGASQSAVEIILDIAKRNGRTEIHSIHRSFGFRLKDTSPFSDHAYFPEFVDYFYNASSVSRRHLEQQLSPTNYSSVDGDVLEELYLKLYEDKLDGRSHVHIHANSVIDSVDQDDSGVHLSLREIHTGEREVVSVDAVVLATGFANFGTGPGYEPYPRLLHEVAGMIEFDDAGVIAVDRDYRVPMKDANAPQLYLNGLCESTHGLGDAGSFSLVSLRAGEIRDSLVMHQQSRVRAGLYVKVT